MSKMARVYGIEFEGRIVYVGVTMQHYLSNRMASHYSHARMGKRATKKFGPWLLTNPPIKITVLETCNAAQRFEREQFWIDFHDCIAKGFNCPRPAGRGRPKGCTNPTGKDHPRSRPVKCLENGEVFASITAAASRFGLFKANVHKVVNGKLRSTGGLTFELCSIAQGAS